MAKRQKAAFWRKGFFVVAAVAVLGGIAFAGAQFGHKPIIAADTPNGETKRVIVQFKNVAAVTSRSNVAAQQAAIAKADAKVQDATPYSEGYKLKVRSYDNLPYAAYVVDAAGEASLKSDPSVVSVREDNVIAPEMNQVLSTLGGTVSGFTDSSGTYDGSGVAVAILDTGALTSHAMLSGKVKAEGCFSESGTYSNATLTSLCAGGAASATGAGASSASCGVVADACDHGTHVSSIAAGTQVSGTLEGSPISLAGVASGADIVSIQVFTQVSSATVCPAGENPCLRTFDSLVASGVDYIISLINNNTLGEPIVAANMSLGGGAYDNQATCTASAPIYAQAVSSLRSHNVAPIISNGNSGDTPGNENKIGAPACVNGAIAIGATNKAGNTIASYSQNGALTTLLAPGGDYDGSDINSVVIAAGTSSNSAVAGMQGTSMAAPVVTGTFAVLREKHPNATVDQLISLLQSSGANVTETRSGYTQVTKKRVALANALTQSPYATINTFTGPSGTINQGAAITLNGTVSNATSCSLNNGVGSVTLTGNSFTKSVPGAASYVLTCKNVYNDTVTRTLNFTVNAAPTQPTVESSNFDAAAGTFVINWGASTDTDGVEEYQIFLNGQLVDTVDSTVLSYTIQNLDPNASYTVEVRAVDTLGAISTAASVTFGHISGDDDEREGVPNTGVAGIVTNSGAKLAIFAGLSIAIIAGIVFAVRRNTSR